MKFGSTFGLNLYPSMEISWLTRDPLSANPFSGKFSVAKLLPDPSNIRAIASPVFILFPCWVRTIIWDESLFFLGFTAESFGDFADGEALNHNRKYYDHIGDNQEHISFATRGK